MAQTSRSFWRWLLLLSVVSTLSVLLHFSGHMLKIPQTLPSRRALTTMTVNEKDSSNQTDVYVNRLVNNTKSGSCSKCFYPVNASVSKGYEYFTDKYSLNVEPMTSWVKEENVHTFCDGQVKVFNDLFAILHDVTLNPLKRYDVEKQARGGEEIKDVLNQNENKENYKFKSGFLEMECSEMKSVGAHTQKIVLLKSLNFIPMKNNRAKQALEIYEEKYVIAVRRQDYANLHNWVRNIYNTFVIMIHFKLQPRDISVLFMDGHPRSELDKSWEVIYGTPLRVGHLSKSTQFKNLILGLEENEGLISNFLNTQVPYLEEFRSFVLSQFDLDSKTQLDCSNLRITIIIRRNAVYHPRNVEGRVGRKIFNEASLIHDLMKAFPHASVQPSLMEALPMLSQLNVIRRTDVLIGMHGAGMSHVTFLPKHAGILELFAKNFKKGRPWFDCFHSISKWRGMKYDSWENFDASLEMPADFTILPTQVIVNKTKGIIDKLCPK